MPQTRPCSITGEPFEISDGEIAFLAERNIPLPTISPRERLRKVMASRNEWKLYRRTCDKTKKEIISAYPPESPFTVYRNDIWWGDSWDALTYGRAFDFVKPFFVQYEELQKVVPREGTSVFRSENCDYNSHIRDSKNCYMNSLIATSEDTHFSYWIENGKDVIDCMLTNASTLSYECVDCDKCYDVTSLEESRNCNDCHFCFQLTGCDHCLLSSNLANRSYYLRNAPCTKEEFAAAKTALLCGSYAKWKDARAEYLRMREASVHRALHNLNCENVIGDHMYNAKNCLRCFDGHDAEDCTQSISMADTKDIISCYSAGWPRCEQIYFSAVSRGSIDLAFCRYTFFGNNLRYCDSCISCKHCFGCIGLRHKEYCILNTQYTKEEYEKLVPQIIDHMGKTGEWGEFFPPHTMPFSYNESAAQDYLPLSENEARKMGFTWRDTPEEIPVAKRVITAASLPDNIDDMSDDLLQSAIQCEKSGKPFKIVKQELDFYRRMRLPLPRLHPTERHRSRMARRNPYQLWIRKCTKCGQDTWTTYAPERPEMVACEECYLKEIY